MADTASLSFRDYDNESSTFSINVNVLDDTNFEATNTAVAALRTATLAITMGTITGFNVNAPTIIGGAIPADSEAQREKKWLVIAEDVTQWLDAPTNTIENPGYRKLFRYEIPTADLNLLADNSAIVFPKTTAVAPAITAWIGAFESVAKSPYTGTLNVRRIEFVGRNL